MTGVFVSRHAAHNIILEIEDVEYVTDTNNKLKKMIKKLPLSVQFTNDWWMLDAYQRSYALQAFYEGIYRDEQGNPVINAIRSHSIGSESAEIRVTEDGIAEYTVADRREHHLGVFYPESIANEEERERVIKLLLAQPEHGQSFIYIEPEKLPAPWPAYDSMDVKKIVQFATDGDYDFKIILAYEKQNKNRKELVEALATKEQALKTKQEEDESLSTTA